MHPESEFSDRVSKRACPLSTNGVFLTGLTTDPVALVAGGQSGALRMSLRTACGSRASVWVVTVALLAALSSCQNRHQSFGSGAASPSAAAVPTGGPPRVRGFVLSNVFVAAPPDEPGACPQLSKGPLELFLESLPAAQRKSYAAPEQREALMKLMNQRVGFRSAPVPVDPNTGQADPAKLAQT